MDIFKKLPYELKIEVIKQFNIFDLFKIYKIYPNIILYLSKSDIQYIVDNTNYLKYDILELHNEVMINKNIARYLNYNIITDVIINSDLSKYSKIIKMPLSKNGSYTRQTHFKNDKILFSSLNDLFLMIQQNKDDWKSNYDICHFSLTHKVNTIFNNKNL
jgi:hypothetical protein